MHWERAGSAGRKKEGGCCPFSGFGRDKEFFVTIEFILSRVATGLASQGTTTVPWCAHNPVRDHTIGI